MSRKRFSPPAAGGSSLLVIFGILAMTVFALLSLTSALARQRLAEHSLEAVSAYYEADNRAEAVFAALRAGELPPEVAQAGNVYSFSCEISENQQLMVELKEQMGTWSVVRWQAVPGSTETDTEALPVWDGSFS